MTSNLKLDGAATNETLTRLETDGENSLAVEATTDGQDIGARAEVSHARSRWSVAAVVEWWQGKGVSAGAKGKWKF